MKAKTGREVSEGCSYWAANRLPPLCAIVDLSRHHSIRLHRLATTPKRDRCKLKIGREDVGSHYNLSAKPSSADATGD